MDFERVGGVASSLGRGMVGGVLLVGGFFLVEVLRESIVLGFVGGARRRGICGAKVRGGESEGEARRGEGGGFSPISLRKRGRYWIDHLTACACLARS